MFTLLLIINTGSNENKRVHTQKYNKPITKRILNRGLANNLDTYERAIRNASQDHGVVVLVYVDLSYLDLAWNFYVTSIEPHPTLRRSVLFVTTTPGVCRRLERLSVGCHVYRVQIPKSGSPAVYDTSNFIDKMNIRLDMITDALRLGTILLHTDVDVTFFEDPLPVIERACARHQCQMAAMLDVDVYNAGFVYLRPEPEVLLLYRRLRHLCRYKHKDDQTCLNDVIRRMPDVRVVGLPIREFQSGVQYFEIGRSEFGENQRKSQCVVLHNNWLVGKDAKVYRYQENGLWKIDFLTRSNQTIEKYYSQENNRYLTFDVNSKHSLLQQAETLKNALILGHILHRIVILPKFRCANSPFADVYYCNILHVVDFSRFQTFFASFFREHKFLDNDLVPDSVRKDREQYGLMFKDGDSVECDSHVIYIASTGWRKATNCARARVVYLTGINNTLPESILADHRVHAISDAFSLALRPGNYRQYNRKT